mmetsp:Transcript_25425/g.45921  ORF Transcript_25425/g.45921 Transcript_25425/m.45921 type:complete len:82 (-) Transcript_25425:863-1108(-)
MQYGLEINHYGGIYHRGKSYDHCKKVEVAAAYKLANEANGGMRPSLRSLAKHCQVNWHFVHKIEKELETYGRVLKPHEICL